MFSYNAGNDPPLRACDPPYINLPAGSGPRHLTFDKRGRWLYLLTELSGEIFMFPTKDPSRWLEKQSIIAEGYSGKIEAADIQIHPTRNYLYASNRAEANEIVIFKMDARNGSLTFLQRTSAEGSGPRSLLISPDGRFLLAANEQSNTITVFQISASGRLQYTGSQIKVNKPTCLKWLKSNK
jgi:6-phosphogluconolactonase